MEPPINGENKGPMNTFSVKIVTWSLQLCSQGRLGRRHTAIPRALLSYMSTNTAPATASGLVPKKPAKKRVMSMLCISLLTATAK